MLSPKSLIIVSMVLNQIQWCNASPTLLTDLGLNDAASANIGGLEERGDVEMSLK